MIAIEIESDLLVYIEYAICLVLSNTYHFLTDDSRQSADKGQQESRAVAEKPHDAVVNFDTYRNLQWHRMVLPEIARLSCMTCQQTNKEYDTIFLKIYSYLEKL